MPVTHSLVDCSASFSFCWSVGVDDSLGGVVRFNGALYPAPFPADNALVISALTDKGLAARRVWCCQNHDADSHISPAPELMEFHLENREAPLFCCRQHTRKQPDHLFRSLGFNRTDEWRREEDARTHHREET